jgi:hypothetical protein
VDECEEASEFQSLAFSLLATFLHRFPEDVAGGTGDQVVTDQTPFRSFAFALPETLSVLNVELHVVHI